MPAVVILLVVGFAAGWWCGTRWAEIRRAQTDMAITEALAADDLRTLATDRGLTLSAALRQAITSAKFISDQTNDAQGKLLIEKSNGDKQQIVFQ
jgi:hypothetical protein